MDANNTKGVLLLHRSWFRSSSSSSSSSSTQMNRQEEIAKKRIHSDRTITSSRRKTWCKRQQPKHNANRSMCWREGKTRFEYFLLIDDFRRWGEDPFKQPQHRQRWLTNSRVLVTITTPRKLSLIALTFIDWTTGRRMHCFCKFKCIDQRRPGWSLSTTHD